MKLSDKAEETPDVTLAGDLIESAYELQSDDPELVPADELTAEDEFPKYGDFLEVVEYSPYDGTDRGECYVEVPQRLAAWLVENEVGDGERWKVVQSQKVDGEWQFEVELVDGE